MMIDNNGNIYIEGSMTRTLPDGSVWSGIPTSEQLEEWGFVEETPPAPHIYTENELIEVRMQEILDELRNTDYLALKAFEGEDMSDHPGWKEQRAALRIEYRQLEEQLNNLDTNT